MALQLSKILDDLKSKGGYTITPKGSCLKDLKDLIDNQRQVRSQSGVTCSGHTNFTPAGVSLGDFNAVVGKVATFICACQSYVPSQPCTCVSDVSCSSNGIYCSGNYYTDICASHSNCTGYSAATGTSLAVCTCNGNWSVGNCQCEDYTSGYCNAVKYSPDTSCSSDCYCNSYDSGGCGGHASESCTVNGCSCNEVTSRECISQSFSGTHNPCGSYSPSIAESGCRNYYFKTT